MKNKKILIIISAVIGLVILLAILEKTHVINMFHKTPTPTQGPTAEQKQQEADANADAKKQLLEEKAKTDGSTVPSTNSNKSIDLSAKQETNNTVTVFTKLPGYSDGSCELTTTNGVKTYNQSAKVIYQAEFSSCAGFSIPISVLGKGSWSISLAVTSNGATESKSLTFEVQ